MLSAKEIKNACFATALSGYKKDEVDVLLDKVEADYEQFERTLREMNNKINELKTELEDYKNAQGNIQNVLISAQKFADQIVEEAKTKSAEIVSSAHASIEKITAQEKELTTAFDKKASERKDAFQKDMDVIISAAKDRQAAVENATQDCIDRQQLLFNKMKLDTAKYKEHLELLASLPDAVPNDPTEIADAIKFEFNKLPSVEEYVENPQVLDLPAEPVQEPEEAEFEEPAEKLIETVIGKGFVINDVDFDVDTDETTEQQEDI